MIVHLKRDLSEVEIQSLAKEHQGIVFLQKGMPIMVLSSKVKELPKGLEDSTDEFYPMGSDIQLSSKSYRPDKREVQIGELTLGGDSNNCAVITGPCSIESWEQITACADLVKKLNLKILRAGCYKPRTSPYSFQGLGLEGLKMLAKVREEYGLKIITEVKDFSHVNEVIEYSDIVQVGAKAMYDQGILKACGKTNKPVLLKRGFGSTLQEFVQAAEFVLSGGNSNVILCERGIRTFVEKTRFTLDLCGVAYLKEYCNLPIILDPSHAMGYAYGIADLSRACLAMDVDGLLIESHPNPAIAKSDGAQQLDLPSFENMFESLKPIASAIGRSLV